MERLETRRANVGGSHVGRGDELHQPERDLGIRQRCDVRAEGELAVERGWDVALGEIDVRIRELLRERLEVLPPLRSAMGGFGACPATWLESAAASAKRRTARVMALLNRMVRGVSRGGAGFHANLMWEPKVWAVNGRHWAFCFW